ncbi:GrpB family protein [Rhizobium sp. TRM95796]|uniref:GrpB family protein n=1 Tax=Rhizobium sp. TRM95796 TaxID=2979862 RepID=UPI0021E82D61|nr:GrpB family protein [Rhizobium sp. TRM95796]MCV3766699.1 GrpB family protein [Rhizobium sp. TRM95796]
MTNEPVIIVAYDPAWPEIFEALRRRIEAALGPIAIAVEHVGSTAVPGLPAKPIIDIDVAIAGDSALPTAIAALATIGYAHQGEKGIAGRHAFAAPAGLARHHLYLCAAHSAELRRHLAFRDRLRADAGLAAAYGALKMRLAEEFGWDREGYTIAKTSFIETALEDAP